MWEFIFNLTTDVARCGAHLVPLVDCERRAAETFWLRAFLDCVNASEDGTKLALHQLAEPPPGSPIRPPYTEIREPYAEMRAKAEVRLAELRLR
jgi:hypothetical protein